MGENATFKAWRGTAETLARRLTAGRLVIFLAWDILAASGSG
jgi:hypothetical protein